MTSSKNTQRKIPGIKAKFTNNEPIPQVRDGSTRTSTSVTLDKYPAIERRRQINGILSMHCAPDAVKGQLQPSDEAILIRMVNETVSGGTNPVLRKNAIRALVSFPTVNTINLLSELAEMGEDEYIRSCAVETLGGMEIRAVLPIFIAGLKDRAEIVKNASRQALSKCVDAFGAAIVRAVSQKEKSAAIRKTVEEIITSRLTKSKKPAKQRKMRRAVGD